MKKRIFLSIFALAFCISYALGQLPGIYTYDFANGSLLPQTSYTTLRYTTFTTKDGILTLNSNSDNEKLQFGYHDAQHGAVFFPGNTFKMIVAGNATITFNTCQYGVATDGIFEFTDSKGTILGQCPSHNIGTGACGTNSFSYTGTEVTLTATLKSAAFPTAEIYIHGLTIENASKIVASQGKIDVWDFGAAQLDTSVYKNNLTVDIINSWYAKTITAGTSGNVLPSFTAGVLSWFGGSNDRLRTTNTSITRYDENIAAATDYTGRIYVNSSAATGRYLSLTLNQDDELTIATRTDAGGNVIFQYVPDPTAQTDAFAVTDLVSLKFVAKAAGTYHIFDNKGKPSYFRIYRKDATYATLAGSVDLSQAPGIPGNYAIVFKNKAGKTWKSSMTSSGYSVKIPAGYTYALSLSDANGFIITNGDSLEVKEKTTSYNVTVKKVELYKVSGSISGIDSKLAGLALVYTPDPSAKKFYKPEPVIDVSTKTYSVQLEPNCQYTISAKWVNDFYIPNNTITIGNENKTADIVFTAKPLFNVTINATGISTDQLSKLALTFTNLKESGYVYSFPSVKSIALRDGTYSVAYSGLDDYSVELGLTSNLKVAGSDVAKNLAFKPIPIWSFDDKAIASGATSYKGLLFTGSVGSELAKGHLLAKSPATIKVPVNAGDKIKISYYYTADFTIGGTTYTTSSNSTTKIEYAEYIYKGTNAGYETITIGSSAGTTYITEIEISKVVEFKSIIYVGTNKEYKTINNALDAIATMPRPNNERVTVMIDPGNYEEMLVVSAPNVTLKNASDTPNIELANKGVDIATGAVRITSYYGHGYNYYSMGTNQKWNADLLRVNKENGYLSYENKGSGTTNGSYWNATVVISATGFIAENIIFENSFNQYISRKESEDVVVMWESGNKGLRPVDVGNTSVQKRSFVERAAAIAIIGDKAILNKCRVVGRQDSYYGGTGVRVAVYKGAMMGAVDYLFGGMTAVFYKTDLVMNVSDDSNDASYLTAAQQTAGRGFLMYECTIKAATTGTQTASTFLAKPGYFGRPWQATTSEVIFYNTTIETTNFTGSEGKSLISPAGWNSSLGGESKLMYEYGTIENSGENNQSSRVSWSTVLKTPTLNDGTPITTFNFTKGTDNWDPIQELEAPPKMQAILYVAPPTKIDATTGKNADQPVMDFLTAAGYKVIPFGVTKLQNATQAQIDSLNAAALIIIGRGCASGDFSTPSKQKWHAIKAPILSINLWALRTSRMNWFKTADSDAANVDSSFNFTYKANLNKPTDPVFAGLTTPVGWYSGPYSILKVKTAGNGTILASSSTDQSVLFARFEPNVRFYADSADTPAGLRTYMGNGSDNMSDAAGNKIFNYFNFTKEGKQVFLNEVARMSGIAPIVKPTGPAEASITKASFTPVIDGIMDDKAWIVATQYNIDKPFTGDKFASAADLSGYWKATYNDKGIYVLVNVTKDDIHYTDGVVGQPWEKDIIGVYFDMNPLLKDGGFPGGAPWDGHNSGHYQIEHREKTNPGDFSAWCAGCEVKITYDSTAKNTSVIQELFVPWTSIPSKDNVVYVPSSAQPIGFDVYISDNDGGANTTPARRRLVWSNVGNVNENYNFMDDAGTIKFTDSGIPEVYTVLPISKIVFGKVDDAVDYKGDVSIRWDIDSVYMIYTVADEKIVNTGNAYQVDNLEIYFDIDNSKNIHYPRNGGWLQAVDVAYDANDWQLRLVPDVAFATNNTARPSIIEGYNQVYKATPTGYTFNLNVAWSVLMKDFVPVVGKKIGFDVLLSDNDATASDANRNQITWNSPTGNPYNDPSLFGTLELTDNGLFKIITDIEKPSAPANVVATVTESDVKLTWDPSTDNIAVQQYIVYQGSTAKDPILAKKADNTITIKALANGDYSFTVAAVDVYGNTSAKSAAASAKIAVGINKINISVVNMYPNPAKKSLYLNNIKSDKAIIYFYNSEGQLVLLRTLTGKNEIDIAALRSGIYLIKVLDADKMMTGKFIKE